MGLNTLVRSKGYKNFMAKLYGIGAAVVILGALFKILHLHGADIMLIMGMGTEAIIFTFSAFEPLHVEYNWSLVYPELALGLEEESKPKKEKKKALPNETVTQQLDRMLEEAKIGPDLIESLASGMRNLSENAKTLSGTADAVAATDGYVSNLTKAGESVRNLALEYDKSAEMLNSTTELQMQNSQTVLNNFKLMEDGIAAYAETLSTSLENTKRYQEEIEKLAQNVSQLSNIYGNMLSAMTTNK